VTASKCTEEEKIQSRTSYYLVNEEVGVEYGYMILGIEQGRRLISRSLKRRDDDEDSNGRILYVFCNLF
jgi:hypothetical protein